METLLVSILFLVIVAVSLVAASNQQKMLKDPENTEVVYLEQVSSVARMRGRGRFLLKTYRQSGKRQKDDAVFNSAAEAIAAGVSSFKRSKIQYVVIRTNTSNMLYFSRPYHCHRGRQEGRKMGAIEIVRV